MFIFGRTFFFYFWVTFLEYIPIELQGKQKARCVLALDEYGQVAFWRLCTAAPSPAGRERTHRCDGHRRPRGGAEGGHWCLPQSTGGESALSRTQMHISVLQTLCTSFKGDTVFCCPLLALPDCSQSRHSPRRVCAYLALTVKFQQARSREGGFMVLMIITLHSFELSALLKN